MSDLLLRAFLPGTLVAAVASLAAIGIPHGWLPALLICALALWPLRRIDVAQLRRPLAPPLLCLPLALLFATILGFRLHGPTASLGGSPPGDTAIYVGGANTLREHVLPLFNYANEGFSLTFGNVLPSLLASPWLDQAWFDPYLFFSASLTVLASLSIALLLPLYMQATRPIEDFDFRASDFLIVAGLIGGALRTPSALVESPPFVFFVPIVFSTVYLWLEPRSKNPRLWQALATAAVGSTISKLVGFGVLVPLQLPDIAHVLVRRASRRQIGVAAAGGAILVLYMAIAALTYLPGTLKLARLGPSSWDLIVRYHLTGLVPITSVLSRDIGALLLTGVATFAMLPGLALAAWAGVLSFLTLPFVFYSCLTAVMLAVALTFVAKPQRFGSARSALLLATLLLLLQTTTTNFAGWAASAAWLVLIGSVTWLSSRPSEVGDPSGISWGLSARKVSMSGLAALFLAATLWGASRGALYAGPSGPVFSSDMRDIWLNVRARTPRGALIFTDQTGPTESRLGGWDDFALAARRQFYLVSWEVTPLRFDPKLRQEWLDRNAAILDGRESPEELKLSRAYDGFYAVLSSDRAPPPGAVPIYANHSFNLYRLQPTPASAR